MLSHSSGQATPTSPTSQRHHRATIGSVPASEAVLFGWCSDISLWFIMIFIYTFISLAAKSAGCLSKVRILRPLKTKFLQKISWFIIQLIHFRPMWLEYLKKKKIIFCKVRKRLFERKWWWWWWWWWRERERWSGGGGVMEKLNHVERLDKSCTAASDFMEAVAMVTGSE